MVLARIKKSWTQFCEYEASGGVLLVCMATFAIILANTRFAGSYFDFLHIPVTFRLGFFSFDEDLVHFVNDALMAIFFLLVTLEIKREMKEGCLSTKEQRIRPIYGAIGGIVVPALIYVALNRGVYMNGIETVRGWAIPTATDIAFAVGVISLFGKRVPISLKVFLVALAIVDDLAAILIIAFFYSADLSIVALLCSAIILIFLIMLNVGRIDKKWPYVILGIFLWYAVLKSGIHATIAGVALGFLIPFRTNSDNNKSMLKDVEHALNPWVSYVILPLFAFLNAGVSINGIGLANVLADPVVLGIILGLFFGK